MSKFALMLLISALLAMGCSSIEKNGPLSLEAHIAATTADFFENLSQQGTAARVAFTLFVPDGAVHRRYLTQFKESLERNVRQAAGLANLTYQGSADRVFFLSDHRPKNWETPPGTDEAEALAREFRNGTKFGWTILHAYWAQLNHLLYSGDAAFIESLPGSMRADLTHPLHYVLRVEVVYESQLGLTAHRHIFTFELVKVGGEEMFYTKSYPVTLSARITE